MKVVVDLVFIETLIIFQCLSEINATKMTLTGNCIFHFKEEKGVEKSRMGKADMAEEKPYLSKCQKGRSIQKTKRQRIWLVIF